MDILNQSLEELINAGGFDCACGRHHGCGLKYLKIGPGAVQYLVDALKAAGGAKAFIICDKHTEAAAWAKAEPVLAAANFPYKKFVFPMEHVEPDEYAVGSCLMAFDPSCDVILGIGSGVVNDCCKVLAHAVGCRSVILGTAPSMDGYASNSSSMIQNRIKVSLYNACPAAIVADTDIIRLAPMRMLQAGLGDMLAKYVALCEWRISHLVTDEYYCADIAALMRKALARIVAVAPKLKDRDADAVQATVEGLILSGLAMAYAEISRPASGLEHYFSHLWEMMALDRGTPYELHGIQVGVGTLLALKIYDWIRTIRPDRAKAEAFMASFTDEAWQEQTRRIFGKAAQAVIDAEHNQHHKNDPERQKKHFARIEAHWDEILKIIDEELPPTKDIAALMASLEMPMAPADLGISAEDTHNAFIGSRDIRDKYLTSTMLWEMGLMYETPMPE